MGIRSSKTLAVPHFHHSLARSPQPQLLPYRAIFSSNMEGSKKAIAKNKDMPDMPDQAKLESEYAQYLMAKYFSGKDIYGEEIFEETAIIGGITIKASGSSPTRSYADPVSYQHEVAKAKKESLADIKNTEECRRRPLRLGGESAGKQVGPSGVQHQAGKQVGPSGVQDQAGKQVGPSGVQDQAGKQVGPSGVQDQAGKQVGPSGVQDQAGKQVGPSGMQDQAGKQVGPSGMQDQAGKQVGPSGVQDQDEHSSDSLMEISADDWNEIQSAKKNAVSEAGPSKKNVGYEAGPSKKNAGSEAGPSKKRL